VQNFLLRKKPLILIMLIVLFSSYVAGQELRIDASSTSASSAFPWILQGVTVQQRNPGGPVFILEPAGSAPDASRDLLLSFSGGKAQNSAGRWLVRQEGQVDYKGEVDARIGDGAASFVAPRGKLILEPRSSQVFSPGLAGGDFTIDFWLKPVRADNGEIIFLYRSTIEFGRNRFAQQIAASISRNRMTVAFFNFFMDPAGKETTATLQGQSVLVPGRWSHHLVRFDNSTGLLEYWMDARLEAVQYMTSSGREGGTVFSPIAGTSIRFDLAPNYTGLLDEFRISSRYLSEIDTGRYASAGGSLTSPVFDLGSANSLLRSIESRVRLGQEASIHYFYRFADSPIGWTDSWPIWQAFVPGQAFPAAASTGSALRGRYIQLRLHLYPDASREISPVLEALTVRFEPDDPPPPPAWVAARAGDGRITVQWSSVSEADVSGYLIYYGTSPGNYYGTGATEGRSPIIIKDARATSAVLNGLQNGTLYFIAVAAMDSAEPPQVGEFSGEVNARPSRINQ